MDRQVPGRAIGAERPVAGAPLPGSRLPGSRLPGSRLPGSRLPGSDPQPVPGAGHAGLVCGTEVATLDGVLPVEFLAEGDRIVTRSGARVLRAISSLTLITDLVQVAPGVLGQGRPGRGLTLGAGTGVLLRDWRARALFGRSQVLVAAARLVDGQFITRIGGCKARLFTLHFDAPEVIYAEGAELGCASPDICAPGSRTG